MTATVPQSMISMVERVADCLPQFPRLPRVFADTFANTFTTTLKPQSDGSVFVITGDIPAMWLRDSAAQVTRQVVASATSTVRKRMLERTGSSPLGVSL